MRIVVTDDRAAVCAVYCQCIRARFPGAQVMQAASLTATLRALVDHHPVDVSVMDLAANGMNGFQGLSTVRRFFPEVRCIVVGTPEPGAVHEASRLGARGFVPAPLPEAELVAAVTAVLAGRRHLPSQSEHLPGLPGLSALARLTPRERDILMLLRDGLPNKIIANRLSVSEVTVKSHLGSVFKKLGVRNRLQALRAMAEAGGL